MVRKPQFVLGMRTQTVSTFYLKGIEQLHNLSFKGQFDIDKLKQDVQTIFVREGWHKIIPAA